MARRATVALALFPTSYFLWMDYSVALFVTATAAAVWAGRREWHTLAAVFLAVASTTRLVGVTVGPALALARIVRLRRVDSVSVRYVLGSLAGLVAVMARHGRRAGDPLGWLEAGRAWDRQFDGPWTALYRAAGLIVDRLPDRGLRDPRLWRSSPWGASWSSCGAASVAATGRSSRRPSQPALARAHLQSAHLQPGALHDGVLAGAARLADAWPRLPRAVRLLGLIVPVAMTVVALRICARGVHRLTAGGTCPGLTDRGRRAREWTRRRSSWALLDLGLDASDVAADDAQAEHLHPAHEQDGGDQPGPSLHASSPARRPSGDGVADPDRASATLTGRAGDQPSGAVEKLVMPSAASRTIFASG